MTERNLIIEMLEEELDRNVRAQKAYVEEHNRLPRGSICVKRRGEKAYCYLKYREGTRTITDYAGVADKVEEKLRTQIARRKDIEAAIRQLKAEQRYIEKALSL